MKPSLFQTLLLAVSASLFTPAYAADNPNLLRMLFLGDNGPHQPAARFKELQPVLARRGIEMVYTDTLRDLASAKLAGFDGLIIFANHTRIEPDAERALLDFVAAGGGLVPLHCASYCFHNSPAYIELVGGQFRSHGTGVFKETITQPQHEVMTGLNPIESWDESYVHTRHNTNRVVLAERRDDRGAEPYTWIRQHGKGRVFYTAWGHDQRTWSNPDFHALVERGIRWACGNSFTRLSARTGLSPFEYAEAADALPNYVPDARWGTQGDPIRVMQKPLDPARSMAHLATFPEFEVSLFAAEPDIVKPIWLSWDERGRLWIAETVDYPNELQPLGEGRDRLKICEDTDGDGRADKFTVFADKLSVPTGFVFAKGGVIVIHSGRTELFKDTNGDDQADVREVLFSGWGTGDTHATASNLRYGFDNWIWGVVGYSGFRGEVGGEELQFGQGIFRFKPDGSKLEFVRSSNNNTWGLGITEDNLIFGSTANGNASMYLPIPNRYYETVRGWSASRLESIADSQRFYPITAKVRQVDWHGQYTAGAGSAIYTARQFPKEYWNRVQFVAEPTGHLLGKFHLEPRGADFVAHNGRNFLASDDEWSSPIAAEVGPDGALWISDWYNYIIQHNPTPRGFRTGRGNAYDTPLRDKTHGRVYRVAYKDARRSAPPQLDPAQPDQLLAALSHDNLLWRLHAQRLLIEGNHRNAIARLQALTRDPRVDPIGLNPPAIHALWTLHAMGALDGSDAASTAAAAQALEHPSAAVRRAAATVLPKTETVALLKRLDDPDAQVRLATLLALSEAPPSAEAGWAIFAMLQRTENAEDRWIADAATSAAARHDAGFLQAVLGSYKPAGKADTARANLMPNASFEEQQNDQPIQWRTAAYGGRAQYSLASTGRTGARSVAVSSENGADAGWSTRIQVQPRTDYRLTGWIKTENVRAIGAARGALFNIHELQSAEHGATPPLTGNNDWTQVHLTFNSGEATALTVNCLFGGWGRATGTAWFDDVELTIAPGAELPGALGAIVRRVTNHYAQRGPVDSIVVTLAALENASPTLAAAILDGLTEGWPQDRAPALADADQASIVRLMDHLPETLRDRLLTLAQRWNRPDLFGSQVAAITASLKRQIADTTAPDQERAAAASRLIGLDDREETASWLLDQVNLLTPPALAGGLVNALTDSRNARTGQSLLNHWTHYTPAVRRLAIAALLRRPPWTQTLLDAVENGAIHPTDLAPEHWSQLKQNPERRIARRAERLSTTSGAVSTDRQEIVDKLLPLALEKGDAARGREVYTANCANCHLFNGEGDAIGPALTGIGARSREEILLEILDPNRSVEANYRSWNVTTRDGDVFSGRMEAETQTTVELLDSAAQKHVIQRKDIASIQSSTLSIMPTGFEALPADDLKALLEYLAQPQQ